MASYNIAGLPFSLAFHPVLLANLPLKAAFYDYLKAAGSK